MFAPEQIEEMGTNKGMGKKVANRYDFFLSEVPHMGLVGRWLGVILGPRGKMPRPFPPCSTLPSWPRVCAAPSS